MRRASPSSSSRVTMLFRGRWCVSAVVGTTNATVTTAAAAMVRCPATLCSSCRFVSHQGFLAYSTLPSSAPAPDAKLQGRTETIMTAHGVSVAALRVASDAEDQGVHSASRDGEEVLVRARVERIRGRGKLVFLHLRQPPLESMQAVCEGKALATFAKSIPPESIVDVVGVVRRPSMPVQSTTCQRCELQVTHLHVVSKAATPLPFPYNDANTKLDTRLNHRVIDLRTERMVAVARLVSAIGQSFRNELLARHFIEVHTPKLVGSASEGGSSVFPVDYFNRRAFLAQSPQLYKQMMMMGDAMRVFEVGPVFRAEKSLTHRHLTEFVGLDGEMVIQESHTEVLDVLEPVLCAILKGLRERHGDLIDVVWRLREPSSSSSPGSVNSTGVRHCTDPSLTPPAEADAADVSPRQQQIIDSRHHPLRDVCCEVSADTMVALGIIAEGPATRLPLSPPSAASLPHLQQQQQQERKVDFYNARVAAGTDSCRVLRLSFANAVRLLVDQGGPGAVTEGAPPLNDFSLSQERRLGELVNERYGVDLYVVDGFPSSARPFYTMPVDPSRPEGPTRSYDVYLRGEEICSGAQRVHDVALLEQRLTAKGVEGASVKDYIDAFRYGAWPHGGFGLGLERIALFFLGLEDIRQVSLFPRDPKRLSP